MATITLEYVLAETDDYTYKPEVVALAKELKEINDTLAASLGNVAKLLVSLGHYLDVPPQVLKDSFGALADLTGVTEDLLEKALLQYAARKEAFIKPPAGTAETVVIVPGNLEAQ